jgi:cytochrome c peroxidase
MMLKFSPLSTSTFSVKAPMKTRHHRWLDAGMAGVLVSTLCVIGCAPKTKSSGGLPDAGPAVPNHLAAFVPPPLKASSDIVALGRLLFFDRRLSDGNKMSCATCHQPDKGFCDAVAKGTGNQGKLLGRNTPSVINVDARAPFFWDGRAATAEEQALMPVANPNEMNMDPDKVASTLSGIPEYVARFKQAFGDSQISATRIGTAIASFERTLVSYDAPFDRAMGGEATAMSNEARLGMQLFVGKGHCTKCHDGPHFTDSSFHNIGVAGSDVGRYKIVPVPVMKGAFRTPGLRDVELTAPYFHDGSAKTLEDVIAFYNRGGDAKDNLDGDITPLSLSEAEQKALVAFLKALTGKTPNAKEPRIPVVVEEPHSKSTKDLMKRADGMLQKLDKTIASVDAGQWEEVRQSLAILIQNSEELATLRLRTMKPARHTQLKELLGDLIVAFEDLDASAARHDRAASSAIYDVVRTRCEACHDAFRYTNKKR